MRQLTNIVLLIIIQQINWSYEESKLSQVGYDPPEE